MSIPYIYFEILRPEELLFTGDPFLLHFLKGGDLGHIDHIVEHHGIASNLDPRIVVNCEISKRMGVRRSRPGEEEHGKKNFNGIFPSQPDLPFLVMLL